MLSATQPYLRPNQLAPPPRARPATLTIGAAGQAGRGRPLQRRPGGGTVAIDGDPGGAWIVAGAVKVAAERPPMPPTPHTGPHSRPAQGRCDCQAVLGSLRDAAYAGKSGVVARRRR
jgi:hypothetical protein